MAHDRYGAGGVLSVVRSIGRKTVQRRVVRACVWLAVGVLFGWTWVWVLATLTLGLAVALLIVGERPTYAVPHGSAAAVTVSAEGTYPVQQVQQVLVATGLTKSEKVAEVSWRSLGQPREVTRTSGAHVRSVDVDPDTGDLLIEVALSTSQRMAALSGVSEQLCRALRVRRAEEPQPLTERGTVLLRLTNRPAAEGPTDEIQWEMA